MAAIIVLQGCGRQKDDSSLNPIDVQVIERQARSTIDESVLSVIVNDLISYRGEDAVVEAPLDRPEKIFLDMAFLDYEPSDQAILKEYQPEYWQAIKDLDRQQLCEATDDLRLRTSMQPKASLQIADARVLTPAVASQLTNFYDRPVRASRPGYSKDQSLSVVFLIIPWSKHHAEATYILQSIDGKWHVRLRQFVVYV